MSLVGSLEDLGLGDILQIVSLSRKSGLLLLRSEQGDGRIVFRDGLVRAAFVKGEAEDLCGLLVPAGFARAEDVQQSVDVAREAGLDLAEVLAERVGLAPERLNSLRRERVERCVLRMFTWHSGEFSFEVKDELDERDVELALPVGVNAQYLSMEAARLGDEFAGEAEPAAGDAAAREIDFESVAPEPDASAADDDLVFSGEAEPVAADVAPGSGASGAEPALPSSAVHDAIPESDEATSEYRVEPAWIEQAVDDEPSAIAAEAADAGPAPLVAALVDQIEGEPQAPSAAIPVVEAAEPAPAAPDSAAPQFLASAGSSPAEGIAAEPTPRAETPAAPRSASSLVAIDPELRILEWIKTTLAGSFERIHIFQKSDAGIARIRQYLARGEVPLALISTSVRPDWLSGGRDLGELLRRLRAQAPRMALMVLHDPDAALPTGAQVADAVLPRPSRHVLADRRYGAQIGELAEKLRATLEGWGQEPRAAARAPAEVDAEAGALAELTGRLRRAAERGDVLGAVLDFAAERFSRVAMFMVRDEVAVGIAQRGLERAGGPDDERFRSVALPVTGPAWFRTVVETGRAHCAPAADAGDEELIGLLGGQRPEAAFVAPIEIGGRLVALLYADNLPGNAPMGESTSLGILLHAAGLALDRALLERAAGPEPARG